MILAGCVVAFVVCVVAKASCEQASAHQESDDVGDLRRSIGLATSFYIVDNVRGKSVDRSIAIQSVRPNIDVEELKNLLKSKWVWVDERKAWAEGDYIVVFLNGRKPLAALRLPYSSIPTGDAAYPLRFRPHQDGITITAIVSRQGERLHIPGLRQFLGLLKK